MESREVSRVLRYRYLLNIQVQVQQGKHSVRSGPKHAVPSSCRASAHESTFFNPVTKPFALLAGRAHKTTIAEKTRLRKFTIRLFDARHPCQDALSSRARLYGGPAQVAISEVPAPDGKLSCFRVFAIGGFVIHERHAINGDEACFLFAEH